MDPNRESTRYAEVTNRAGNWKITRAAISVGFRFAYRRGRDARKIVNSYSRLVERTRLRGGCREEQVFGFRKSVTAYAIPWVHGFLPSTR